MRGAVAAFIFEKGLRRLQIWAGAAIVGTGAEHTIRKRPNPRPTVVVFLRP